MGLTVGIYGCHQVRFIGRPPSCGPEHLGRRVGETIPKLHVQVCFHPRQLRGLLVQTTWKSTKTAGQSLVFGSWTHREGKRDEERRTRNRNNLESPVERIRSLIFIEQPQILQIRVLL